MGRLLTLTGAAGFRQAAAKTMTAIMSVVKTRIAPHKYYTNYRRRSFGR
jgi:hypothetical protein